MRRSTRWTSGRALCRTLRRWFPFSFFSLFLSLSSSSSSSFFPPSPRSSFLVHSSPPPSVRLSPPPSIASFSPSGQDSFADRADRHGGHAAILRDERRRETWRESRFSTASNFSLNRGIVAKGSIGEGLDRCAATRGGSIRRRVSIFSQCPDIQGAK